MIFKVIWGWLDAFNFDWHVQRVVRDISDQLTVVLFTPTNMYFDTTEVGAGFISTCLVEGLHVLPAVNLQPGVLACQ